MPDFKFYSQEKSHLYCKSKEYPEIAKKAIKEMYRQVGDLEFDSNGIATQGLLVRHLVMPNLVEDSYNILEFLSKEISKNCYVNIMGQYRPEHMVGKKEFRKKIGETNYKEINRKIHSKEVIEVIDYAKELGLRIDSRINSSYFVNLRNTF